MSKNVSGERRALCLGFGGLLIDVLTVWSDLKTDRIGNRKGREDAKMTTMLFGCRTPFASPNGPVAALCG